MIKNRLLRCVICFVLAFSLVIPQTTAFAKAATDSDSEAIQTTSMDGVLVTSDASSNGSDPGTDVMLFALKAIANKGIGSAASWAAGSLYKVVFGESETDIDKLNKRIDEINANLNEIDERLAKIEAQLKEIGKQQEVIAIESDLQSARDAAKKLVTFVQQAKKSAVFKENATEEERINAYIDLNETFGDAYNDTNILAHYLFDRDNIHTKKSLFYNTRWLSDSQNFLWDTWELEYVSELNSRFTTTYLDSCAIIYGMFSCLQDQAKKGEYKKADYQARIDVTLENAGSVYKEWELNVRPKSGYGTITFNAGDGQLLTFSNKLRGLGTKAGIPTWNYPEGVNKSNMDKATLDKMMHSKERLDDGKTVYAVSSEGYKKFGKIIKSLMDSGKIKKEPIYQWLKEAGFDMGGSVYAPRAKLIADYATYPYEGKALSPDEEENHVHFIPDNDLRYFKTDDAMQQLFEFALYLMILEYNDTGVTANSNCGFVATNLLLLLTPDESLGDTSSPYTMTDTTLSTDRPGEGQNTDSPADTAVYPSWNSSKSGNLVFESDIELSAEDALYLDGERLSEKAYYIDEKNQCFTLRNKFLATLTAGKHIIHQVSTGLQVAENSFSIKNAPLDKAPTLKSAKAGTKKLTAKWAKPSKKIRENLDGYQIMYSYSSSFASYKTKTASAKATTTTIKKLKSKKTCYVKVRKYVKFDGKKYYSPWSKTLSAKVK